MWQRLATETISITPMTGWQKLASQTISITPIVAAGWQKLASQVITITPIAAAGWQKLATKSITITPTGIKPPPEEKEAAFPWGWVAVLGGTGLLALALVPQEKQTLDKRSKKAHI